MWFFLGGELSAGRPSLTAGLMSPSLLSVLHPHPSISPPASEEALLVLLPSSKAQAPSAQGALNPRPSSQLSRVSGFEFESWIRNFLDT